MFENKNHVKLFLDTEFTALQKDADLISIGIVSEDGKCFYAECDDYDESKVRPWLKEHVIKNLIFEKGLSPKPYMASRTEDNPIPNSLYEGYDVAFVGNKKEIRDELCVWLSQFVIKNKDTKLEFWSDCLAYDWVLFNDIFGGAFQTPKYVYYIPFDICTLFKIKGIDPDISREEFIENSIEGTKHNSLYDAKVIKACYEKLINDDISHILNDFNDIIGSCKPIIGISPIGVASPSEVEISLLGVDLTDFSDEDLYTGGLGGADVYNMEILEELKKRKQGSFSATPTSLCDMFCNVDFLRPLRLEILRSLDKKGTEKWKQKM